MSFPKFRLASAIFSLLTISLASAADFTVTSPGSFYSFNGTGQNPTINLVRGRTYTFAVNTASFHPFAIGVTVAGAAPPGVTGNNNTSSGTITFAVPLNAPDCAYYCTFHFFSGTIHMIDPPTPPEVKLVGLTLNSDLVLTTAQLTTNGFTFIPEATASLTEPNWLALTVNSNRFANGTNEIFCGKPVSPNALFRIRIQ